MNSGSSFKLEYKQVNIRHDEEIQPFPLKIYNPMTIH